MKTNLQKSKSFFFVHTRKISYLIVGILITIALPLKSQIHYIDIEPDTIITGDGSKYELDIDSDSQSEFILSIEVIDSVYPLIKMTSTIDSGFVANYMVENCWMAWSLELNDTVQKMSYLFYQPPYYKLAYFGLSYCLHPGFFPGTIDKYLGMKWTKNGHTFFGWLRIDVATDASWFKLKDFAYAEDGILAGQDIMSTTENGSAKLALKLFYMENEILLHADPNLNISNAEIYNCLGRGNRLDFFNSKAIISRSQLKPGIYIVNLSTNQGIYSIKVLIN